PRVRLRDVLRERRPHVVEPGPEGLVDRVDVPERLRNIEASPGLPGATQCVAVPLSPSPSPRAAPLADVQRDARRLPPKLPGQVAIVHLDPGDHGTERREDIEDDRVNTEHGRFLSPSQSAKAPPPGHANEERVNPAAGSLLPRGTIAKRWLG